MKDGRDPGVKHGITGGMGRKAGKMGEKRSITARMTGVIRVAGWGEMAKRKGREYEERADENAVKIEKVRGGDRKSESASIRSD